MLTKWIFTEDVSSAAGLWWSQSWIRLRVQRSSS